MRHGQHIVASLVVISACFGWLASIAMASDEQESSVLVEKQAEKAAEGPAIPAPQSEPTLPPPEKPAPPAETAQPPAPEAKRPFLRPAEPKSEQLSPPATPSAPEAMPAPPAPAIEVRPAPPIIYDTDRGARRMYAKSGQVELMMVTKNPADGCYYEIPLCVPGCCVGEEPRIDCRRGIFGRGVVEYCWPCGFRAEVKFRHLLNDVKVEYDG